MKIFQSLISAYFKIGQKNVQDVSIVASYYYSNTLFEELSEILSAEDIVALKNSGIKIGLDSLDCVFLCSFQLFGKKHLAVLYDYAELYLPTFVWRMVEI